MNNISKNYQLNKIKTMIMNFLWNFTKLQKNLRQLKLKSLNYLLKNFYINNNKISSNKKQSQVI